MLADLFTLLGAAPKDTKREDFNRLIVEENVLGKRTASNRLLTAKHMADLYSFDCSLPVFRLLRLLWDDGQSRPMLALLCALGRDSLLRLSAGKVLETRVGECLTSQDFVAFFHHELPDRFSEAMTLSLAQNVASSWAQAGFFKGRIKKVRSRPVSTPAVAVYALALGYLCGLRGQLLIESTWARFLDVPRDHVIRLAQEAAQRGWMDFKRAGNVFDISFPQILTPKEIEVSHGAN